MPTPQGAASLAFKTMLVIYLHVEGQMSKSERKGSSLSSASAIMSAIIWRKGLQPAATSEAAKVQAVF